MVDPPLRQSWNAGRCTPWSRHLDRAVVWCSCNAAGVGDEFGQLAERQVDFNAAVTSSSTSVCEFDGRFSWSTWSRNAVREVAVEIDNLRIRTHAFDTTPTAWWSSIRIRATGVFTGDRHRVPRGLDHRTRTGPCCPPGNRVAQVPVADAAHRAMRHHVSGVGSIPRPGPITPLMASAPFTCGDSNQLSSRLRRHGHQAGQRPAIVLDVQAALPPRASLQGSPPGRAASASRWPAAPASRAGPSTSARPASEASHFGIASARPPGSIPYRPWWARLGVVVRAARIEPPSGNA